MLCDFGLSRIKADVTSRTVNSGGGSIVGSRHWMAPERLLGGSLKKSCDIYAFAMTLYEVGTHCSRTESHVSDLTHLKIFTNQIPLGHVNQADLIDLVIERNIRPERPDDENSPQLSDPVWELAESCWVQDPKRRPSACALCDTLSHLVDTTATTPSLAPSHSASIPSSTPPTPRLQVSVSLSLPSTGLPPFTSPLHPTVKHRADRSLSPPANLASAFRSVNCAAFSPNGKYVISGSSDGAIMVWDAQTGNTALGPLRHSGSVFCVSFSLDGGRIASGSLDKTIMVWDAVTGKVVRGPFRGHTSGIQSVNFSPDGKQFASCSNDRTVRVWNALTGELLVGPLTGHTRWIRAVTFSMDGKILASGSDDGTIRVWNAESGHLIHGPLKGHIGNIYFVAFSSSHTCT